MLVVAVVVLALYWPLMLWTNVGQAQRTLDSGAELDCKTAIACATQLRNPVLPAPAQLGASVRTMSTPPMAPTSVPYNTLVTAGETLVGLGIATVLGVI